MIIYIWFCVELQKMSRNQINVSWFWTNIGYPHIIVLVGPDIGAKRSGPKRLQHYRWNGEDWIQSKNTDLPRGNGDLEVTSAN